MGGGGIRKNSNFGEKNEKNRQKRVLTARMNDV